MATAGPATSAASAPSWDEQIHWRLARGEETALGELYDRLAPLVHGLAGRILADQAAAEQVTREVFAHLWEHPDSFDPYRGSLRSWVATLTRRRALDQLRGCRATDDGPREREARCRALDVVEALPFPLRETIAVTYSDGRTYRETADHLGIGVQEVKQRLRLGLGLLADDLARATGSDGDDDSDDDGSDHGRPGG